MILAGSVVTLLTDFGWSDPWLAEMKAALLSQWRRYPEPPQPALVDLCHDLAPGDIPAGAWFLQRVFRTYPAGTIHLAVVDPGVGSERPAVAVAAHQQVFVGPGNGLFAWLRGVSGLQIVRLDNPLYHGGVGTAPGEEHRISATFHGRDIFAPAAAHLAVGVPLAQVGSPGSFADLGVLPPAALNVDQSLPGAVGFVRWIDRFGNAITDLQRESPDGREIEARGRVRIVSVVIPGPVATYAAVDNDAPFWYWGSGDTLEIAVRDDSAARRLGLQVGLALTVPDP